MEEKLNLYLLHLMHPSDLTHDFDIIFNDLFGNRILLATHQRHLLCST